MIINKDFQTLPIIKFENYNFFVDDYQRGYKWTIEQVLDLLKDINDFNSIEQSFYCLQPLVVKEMNFENQKIKDIFPNNTQNIFEVIDGQQRLTTIYIILKLIDKPIYSIKYETRKASADFLDNIEKYLNNYSINQISEKEINIIWKEFIDAKIEFNNIDNYHFLTAFLTAKKWFDENEINKVDFKNKLLINTKFIWYEDKLQKNTKKIFRNLNSGKIELTNSELIKALFINLIKNENKEIQQIKQTELATEWDKIEKSLADNEFWYFINNDTDNNKYQTRIDFIFELITQIKPTNTDRLNTYRYYSETLKSNEIAITEWIKIKKCFQQLKEWFDDRVIYHLAGFIICRNFENLNNLLKLNNCKKSDFKNKLIEIIHKKFSVEINDIDNLSYDKDSYSRTVTILLLFNIETYLQSEAQYRFPFNHFKETKWSLEHIHAQNAKEFTKIGEIKIWLNDISELLQNWDKKEVEENNKIKNEIELFDDEIKIFESEVEINPEIRSRFNEITDLTNEYFQIDNINNLALLDGITNSLLNNNNFKKKREEILKIDMQKLEDFNNSIFKKNNNKKPFIPICTKNVFLKYYSKNIKQMSFWGFEDRAEYLDNIKLTLKKYFENGNTK